MSQSDLGELTTVGATLCDADDKRVRSKKGEKLKHTDRLHKGREAPQLDSGRWRDLHRGRAGRAENCARQAERSLERLP